MNNSTTFGVRQKTILALLSLSVSLALHSAEDASRTDTSSKSSLSGAALTAEDKQRAAHASMAESLARQRASIERQTGTTQPASFFQLAPPSRLNPARAAHPSPQALSPSCPALNDLEVGALVDHASKNEGLDRDLLLHVMKQESGFHPCAVSPKGAQGLMQLMPATASQFSVANPFDPASNVNAGARLLKQLLERYKGDMTLALAAYNAGSGTVDAAKGIPRIPETINYVNSILGELSEKHAQRHSGQTDFFGNTSSQPSQFDEADLDAKMMNVLPR